MTRLVASQQKIRTRSMHDRFVKFTSYYNQITMVAKKQHGARQSDHIQIIQPTCNGDVMFCILRFLHFNAPLKVLCVLRPHPILYLEIGVVC